MNLSIGDELTLTVESLALSGEGIAKQDGLVFFLEDALPAEEVRARVTKVEKNLVRAKTTEVLKASPSRVDAPCVHFGICGGCVFQHLTYERQLEVKRAELEKMFKHLGGFENVPVDAVVPSPRPYHYRNNVAMSVRFQNQTPYLGFVAKDNRTFIPVDECKIADERINEFLPKIKTAYKQFIPERKWRRTSQIVMRVGSEGDFFASIKKYPGSARNLKTKVLGKTFEYSGSSFFQTNYSILDDFVTTVRDFLRPATARARHASPPLLDLYCGVGLFAICLAENYESVLGIEDGEEAVMFARRNAAANGIQNAQFQCGRVEDIAWKLGTGTELSACPQFHVVIDPPRAGMKNEVVDALLKQSNIERLVYVSCHPATLIRDLRLLAGRYKIEGVKPFDMFPQTQHLEVVALLTPLVSS